MLAIAKERVNQNTMSESKSHHYSFGYLPDVSDRFFKRKVDQELLSKWALWDGLKIQGFYFDQDYKPYLLDEFVMDFFASPEVATHFLRLDSCRQFTPTGVQMESIRMEKVHCTLTTTELFDRLTAKDSQIIRNSSQIIKCLPEYFLPDPELHDEQFPLEIGDQLRKMIIQDFPPSPSCPDTFENSELKDLYTEDEKKEFLFRIFQHLVLGGSLCQYEDALTNYMEMAKSLYKSLLSISKTPKVIHESGNPMKANQIPGSKPPDECSFSKENEYDISISSVVVKILSARNENYANANQLFFNNHINNFLYLIINPNARTVFTLYHHVI